MKKFEYEKMHKDDKSLHLHRQLVYEVARLFVKERKIHHRDIIKGVYKWAKENAKDYYNEAGEDNIHGEWVCRRLKEAINYQFFLLGDFEDKKLLDKIEELIPEAKNINLNFAPDAESLLMQACLDFDKKLTDEVTSSDTQIVVGVSGGHTMLEFARTLHDIRTSLKWHKEVPDSKRKNVVICSLTSGGTRSNIAALSDTVAANIANELKVKARGFLGPPLFQDPDAKEAFLNDKEVRQHIDLVNEVKIILTSVGNVNDDAALTSQIINSINPEYLVELRRDNQHLGDILYYCYNGYNGNPIPLVPIQDRVYSVIKCKDLWERVKGKKTQCIVVAKGREKGRHALRGVIVRKMASDIHMDLECARGLIEVS